MKMKLVAAVALVMAFPAWSADPPAAQPVAQTSKAPALTDEQVIADFRSDLMAKRADIMAKGLTLTAQEASKFWPLFEQFQKEQDVIVSEQINFTKKYADNFQSLTDEQALEFINALLDRDKKMHDLRVKWLAKFQKVVPSRTAVRAIQLDRRIGNIGQIQISSQIPLVR